MAPPSVSSSAPQAVELTETDSIDITAAKNFSFEIFKTQQELDPSVLQDLQGVAQAGGLSYDKYESAPDLSLLGGQGSTYGLSRLTPTQRFALQLLNSYLGQKDSVGLAVDLEGMTGFLNAPINGVENDTYAKRISAAGLVPQEVLAQVLAWTSSLKNVEGFAAGKFQASDVVAYLKQQQTLPVEAYEAWLNELIQVDANGDGKVSLLEASNHLGGSVEVAQWLQIRQAFVAGIVAPMAREWARSQAKWNFLPTLELARAYVDGLAEEKKRQAHAWCSPDQLMKSGLNLLGWAPFKVHDLALAPFYDTASLNPEGSEDFSNVLDEDGDLQTEYFDLHAQAAGEIAIGEYRRALNSLEAVVVKSAAAHEQAVAKGEDDSAWSWLAAGNLDGALAMMETQAKAWEQGDYDVFGDRLSQEDAAMLRADIEVLREVLPIGKIHDILGETDPKRRDQALLDFALAERGTHWGWKGGSNTTDRSLYNISGRHFNLVFAEAVFTELAASQDSEVAKKALDASIDMTGEGNDAALIQWLFRKALFDKPEEWSDVTHLNMTGRVLGGLAMFFTLRGPGREFARGVRQLKYSASPTGIGYVVEGMVLGRVQRAMSWARRGFQIEGRPVTAMQGAAMANQRGAGLFQNSANGLVRNFPFGIWERAKSGTIAYLGQKFPRVKPMFESIGAEVEVARGLTAEARGKVGKEGFVESAKALGAHSVSSVQAFGGAAVFMGKPVLSGVLIPAMLVYLIHSAQGSDYDQGELAKNWGVTPAYHFGDAATRMEEVYANPALGGSSLEIDATQAHLGIDAMQAHRLALQGQSVEDPQFNQVGEVPQPGQVIELPDMAEAEIR